MRRFLAGLPGGSTTIWAVGVCAVLFAAGVYVQQGRNADQAVDLVNAALVQPERAAKPVAIAEQTEDPQPEEETTQDVTPAKAPDVMTSPPEFDEVRRERDGMTVIAGQGAPGAVISVLQDGVEIATSTVDRSGKFATLALIPPDGEALSLTLSQMSSGETQVSEGEILLAPLSEPVGVAKVAAETAKVADVVETVEAEETVKTAAVETAASDKLEKAAPIEEAAETGEADAIADLGNVVETAKLAETTATPDVPTGVEEQQDIAQSTVIAQTQAPVQNLPSAQIENGDAPQAQTTGETAVTPETQVLAALDPSPPAPTAPSAVLRSNADGVELLNPPTPEVMDNVALDIISYSEAGDVQLAGRAQSQSNSIRIYLDNKPVIELAVDAEGRWRGDVPDVDEGIYTLRVDEVSADGSITSRVETPFKREATEVLAAAAANLDGPIKAITVQKGATLWAIARDRYGDGELYVRVFEANKEAIRDPDLIYPGQIFELPQ